ncbi:DUF2062 domain-containing protein [Fibrobacterota bacterium]
MVLIKKRFQNIKLKLKQAIRAKNTPHDIALGFMLGTFVAILPTPGFSIALGLTIAVLHRRMSKIALAAAYAVWNPLTTAPIYALSYKLGNLLFGCAEVVRFHLEFWNHAWNLTMRFLVGAGLIALLAALVSYFVVKALAGQYQRRRAARLYASQLKKGMISGLTNPKTAKILVNHIPTEEVKP